eukprot:TRINITY_DN5776_c0_g3_i1.p1 TRINITY_DN5776_c0_g3~~TRINITY_DN5776_c0_g3_i1.p1  ORF type:complete len:317 (+),score=27.72 TRINITY_DN5776_c0_g3_i1:47-997(+)
MLKRAHISLSALSILGLKAGASQREIRNQYLKLAKESHPDSKTGSDEKMKSVNAAYRTALDEMSNRNGNKQYDKQQGRHHGYTNQYQYQKRQTPQEEYQARQTQNQYRTKWQSYNPYTSNGKIQGPAGGRSFHYDPCHDRDIDPRVKVCPFPRPRSSNLFGVEAVGNIQPYMALYGTTGPFKNCVVFIIRHNKRRGTTGVVINKPDSLELKSSNVWTGCGGPIDYESALTYLAPGPCVIAEPGLDDVSDAPPTARVLAGYLAWAPLGLDAEIRSRQWNVIPVSKAKELLSLPHSDITSFAKSISRPLSSDATRIDD